MSSTALLGAFCGVCFGAAFTYLVMKRKWWGAIGVLAMSSSILLDVVTSDYHSATERLVRLVVEVVTFPCFAVAVVMSARAQRRTLLTPCADRWTSRGTRPEEGPSWPVSLPP
jgi:hypothetical protein